jgi:6-phosphogluconolactonase
MKITRRCFFSALFCLLAALPAFSQAPDQKFLVFVGTYTDKTDSKGIFAFDFDPSSGKLTPRGLAAETSNPSWLVIHPNRKWAYAANESDKQSSISAFSIDAKSAKLTLLNQLPALGEDPCYLSLDKSAKYLFVANYTSGNVVVFPILPDGKLGEHTSTIRDGGVLGPNKERQEAPHAHWIEPSINGRGVYVADLGLDLLLTYRLDPSNGTLYGAPLSSITRYKNAWSVPVNPGDGPRHAVFGANGHIYVLGEIQSTVTDILLDPNKDIEPVQRISTIPPDYKGRNDAAEIALHPSGKWLFASNRGHDSIALFSVDTATGKLERVGDYSTGGKEPRHFTIDPTGRFLLAENQNSNSIVVFRINPETGALSQVFITEGVPSPVCLVFYPAR